MSVSERRMFCLIWLFGGGGMEDAGGAEEAECGGLEEEWLEGAEEAGDDGTLEEEWLSDEASFCCGCFLGIVKLDLVTLRAPVMWIGPGGKDDWGFAVEDAGFFVFEGVLFWGVTGFLELEWCDIFLSLRETLTALVMGAFLFPLAGAAAAGGGFSGAFSGAASFCSFSSFAGARNQGQ